MNSNQGTLDDPAFLFLARWFVSRTQGAEEVAGKFCSGDAVSCEFEKAFNDTGSAIAAYDFVQAVIRVSERSVRRRRLPERKPRAFPAEADTHRDQTGCMRDIQAKPERMIAVVELSQDTGAQGRDQRSG